MGPSTEIQEDGQLQAALSECIHHYYSDQAREGLEAATRGVALAREKGDPSWLRKLLSAQGVLETDLHNLPRAYLCLSEALALAESLADPAALFSAWNNISGMLAYANLPEMSISAAIMAEEHANRIRDHGARDINRALALSNVAYGSLRLGKYGLGLRSCETAWRLLEPRCAPSERHHDRDRGCAILTLAYRARLLLRAKMLDAARDCLLQVDEMSLVAFVAPRLKAFADATIALGNTYLGNFEQGVRRLLAIASASSAHSPVIIADALADLVEAHALHNRRDEAARYMRLLAHQTTTVRFATALFHHRRHLGWLASVSNFGQDNVKNSVPGLKASTYVGHRRRATDEVLQDLSAAAELHDDASGMHSHRVGELASLLAQAAGFSSTHGRRIAAAARLHDIGKIGVPPSILSKPSQLDDTELEIMRTHTTTGAELLASADIDGSDIAIAVARHHHEWWSGDGYPDQLAGDEIPVEARLAAIAECFDAMTHDRPYRSRLTVDRALAVVIERAGTQFDPELARVFQSMVTSLVAEHADLDGFLQRSAYRSPFLRARQNLATQLAGARRLVARSN